MPPISSLVVAAGVSLIPALILLHARRGHWPVGRLPQLRLLALYAVLVILMQKATQVEGSPAALALVSLVLAMLGLGIGVGPLYRFLYGSDWLEAHPGIAERDVVRWQRVTLVVAVVALLLAIAVAAAGFDPAYAPSTG